MHQHIYKDNEELYTEYVYIRIGICNCSKISVDWWPYDEPPIVLAKDGLAKEA